MVLENDGVTRAKNGRLPLADNGWRLFTTETMPTERMGSDDEAREIHELYRGLWIQAVPVRRAINSDATKRTGASEVIITTYPLNGAHQFPSNRAHPE